jgi:hypothetical protein
VTELAVVFASAYPVDARRQALWNVIDRAGLRDIQRRWLSDWMAPTGRAWSLSHEEVRSIVRPLLPLAEALGETDLAAQASCRLRSILVGYRSHKEYAFEHLRDWFTHASRARPELWRTHGWRIWHLCDVCEDQGGDNRFQADVRDSISAAALRCGVADWWALIRHTVEQGMGDNWHDRTRQRLVDAVPIAVEAGHALACEALPVLWAMGLALSYWHDEDDNRGLKTLRDTLLQIPKTAEERHPLVEALGRTDRGSSLDRLLNAAGDSGSTRENQSLAPGPVAVSSVLDAARAGRHVLPSSAASAIKAIRTSRPGDEAEQVVLILNDRARIGDGVVIPLCGIRCQP